jgi:hypothetical protein
VEHGEFPVSGLRVYVDRNPAGEAHWIILRGTANLLNIFDDLDFVGRDEHELGIMKQSTRPIGFLGKTASVDVSFSDIVKELDMGFMGAFELSRGRWSLAGFGYGA